MNIPSYSGDILIVGYPRSGNSYLARLVGDVLDSPVAGMGSAMPIASEGLNRPGPYMVRQLHLKARRVLGLEDKALLSAYDFNLNAYAGERIVHVYRDPRDVAVSAWKFFDYPSLEDALHSMAGNAPGALGVHGTWAWFVNGWLEADLDNLVQMRYETLLAGPGLCLLIILDAWGIQPINAINEVARRQTFAAKRAQIEQDGDTRPYGKERQLQSLRRGIAGDWRNWFTRREAEIAHGYFWPMLERLEYENDPEWWKI